MKTKPDSTDILILNLLKENATLTTKQIADQISLTSSPVFKRIKWLESNKFIKKYVAVLDEQKISPHMISFTSVQLKEHSFAYMKIFRKKIEAFSEVINVFQIVGDWDFMLHVKTPNMTEYDGFINNKLAQIPEVSQMTTYPILNEEKLN